MAEINPILHFSSDENHPWYQSHYSPECSSDPSKTRLVNCKISSSAASPSECFVEVPERLNWRKFTIKENSVTTSETMEFIVFDWLHHLEFEDGTKWDIPRDGYPFVITEDKIFVNVKLFSANNAYKFIVVPTGCMPPGNLPPAETIGKFIVPDKPIIFVKNSVNDSGWRLLTGRVYEPVTYNDSSSKTCFKTGINSLIELESDGTKQASPHIGAKFIAVGGNIYKRDIYHHFNIKIAPSNESDQLCLSLSHGFHIVDRMQSETNLLKTFYRKHHRDDFVLKGGYIFDENGLSTHVWSTGGYTQINSKTLNIDPSEVYRDIVTIFDDTHVINKDTHELFKVTNAVATPCSVFQYVEINFWPGHKRSKLKLPELLILDDIVCCTHGPFVLYDHGTETYTAGLSKTQAMDLLKRGLLVVRNVDDKCDLTCIGTSLTDVMFTSCSPQFSGDMKMANDKVDTAIGTEPSMAERLAKGAKASGASVVEGFKMSGEERLFRFAVNHLTEKVKEAGLDINTPIVRVGIDMLAAFTLQTVSEAYRDKLPQGEILATGAQRIMTATTYRHVGSVMDIMGPVIKEFLSFNEKLSSDPSGLLSAMSSMANEDELRAEREKVRVVENDERSSHG